MLNLKTSSYFDQRTLAFLEENPLILQSLIAELGSNPSQVATLIEPILEAPYRCEVSSHYIQAVATGRMAFLTTNLPDLQVTHVTEMATNWLIGRSSNCAIAILDQGISRCHAVIGHSADKGFYVMDLGSSNGTFVNGSRLQPLEQCLLSDGDLVEFSRICIEFFISGYGSSTDEIQDTQFF